MFGVQGLGFCVWIWVLGVGIYTSCEAEHSPLLQQFPDAWVFGLNVLAATIPTWFGVSGLGVEALSTAADVVGTYAGMI